MENISYLQPAANPKATLNIYYSDSTTDNCMRSVAFAHERSGSGGENILYLNTGQTERQLHSVIREATGGALTRDGTHTLRILTSPLGEIAFKRDALTEDIRRYKTKHIIINSWEFAAKDARARNILIHTLLYFIDAYDVSVTICSQQGEGATKGYITRGKLGRISAFADKIVELKEMPLYAEHLAKQATKVETAKLENPTHQTPPTHKTHETHKTHPTQETPQTHKTPTPISTTSIPVSATTPDPKPQTPTTETRTPTPEAPQSASPIPDTRTPKPEPRTATQETPSTHKTHPTHQTPKPTKLVTPRPFSPPIIAKWDPNLELVKVGDSGAMMWQPIQKNPNRNSPLPVPTIV